MNPYQLLKKMQKKPIVYGWYDCVHNIKITSEMSQFNEEGYFDKYCRVLKPIETWNMGIETCWGTTLLIWFELNRMGLNPKAFYIEGDKATHCAPYYQDEGMTFWFEYSWNRMRGIHGPFASDDKMIDMLMNEYIKHDENYKTVKFFNKSFDVNAIINIDREIKSNDFLAIAKKPLP